MNKRIFINDKWKVKHEKLLLQNRFEDAQDLKLANLPTRLFRYRPLNDYTLENLQSSSLYLCDLNVLNDPYECLGKVSQMSNQLAIFKQPDFVQIFREHYNADITADEVEQIINDDNPLARFNEFCYRKGILSLEDYQTIQNLGLSILSSPTFDRSDDPMKICSFSERKDSMLMWSHYSDQHKGVCIEYDFSEWQQVYRFLYPVVYSDNLFEFELFENSVTAHSNQLIISVIKKAKDWHYEKEWRLVYPAVEEENQAGYFYVPTPKAIYLGVRFENNSDYKKFLLKRLAKELDIPMYETTLHVSKYKVVSKKIPLAQEYD